MKRIVAVVGIAMCLVMAGCGLEPTPAAMVAQISNTLNPTELVFESTRQVINATATGAFVALEREQLRGTNIVAEATAESARFEATQAEQMRSATAFAYEAELTQAAIQATEAAVQASAAAVEATRVAQATTDGMTLMMAQWTVTADAEIASRQAVAWAGTATADASNATATSVYLGMISTEQANVLRLANERQQAVNEMVAWAPYGMGLIATGLFTWLFILLVKTGIPIASVIKRDERGDIPIIRTMDGNFVDMDRNVGPLLNPTNPILGDADAVERTTARDQAVDLQHRGLPFQQKAAVASGGGKMTAMTPVARTQPRYMIYRPDQTPPMRAEVMEVLDLEWKEANDGNA